MSYDNIKSHKKPVFHPLSRKRIFGKTAEGERGVNFRFKQFEINVFSSTVTFFTMQIYGLVSIWRRTVEESTGFKLIKNPVLRIENTCNHSLDLGPLRLKSLLNSVDGVGSVGAWIAWVKL